MSDKGKRAAAERAAAMVEPGMVIGLGSGSTAELFIAALARRGLDIAGVPSSERTAALARRLGLRLAEAEEIDLTVDGADEVDENLTLVKGGGGALLREKLVAAASRRMICVADAAKLVKRLGTRMPLPIEVIPFLWRSTAKRVAAALGVETVLRQGKEDPAPFVTDGGHFILDCPVLIDDAPAIEAKLKEIVGVVETGLFVGYADEVLVGAAGGETRVLRDIRRATAAAAPGPGDGCGPEAFSAGATKGINFASPDWAYAKLLCQAIEQRTLVDLTYAGDRTSRRFAPHALYWSGSSQVSVTGIQYENPGKRSVAPEPRNFVLRKVTELVLTAAPFSPGPPIDPSAQKYRYGIICAIR